MRPVAAVCALALLTMAVEATAQDGRQAPVEIKAVAKSETSRIASSDTKQFHGFFGYLEFDFDPAAPGGVPGFGDLPNPAQIVAEAARNKGPR